MKKYFLTFGFLCLVVFLGAQKNSAIVQMHEANIEGLKNTEYYDEYYKNNPKAQDTLEKAETMRSNASAVFDSPSDLQRTGGGKISTQVVPGYNVNVKSEGRQVQMITPAGNIPPVSEPVSVSADDIDAMMMGAIGGEATIKASQNSNYQGSYETAVGQKEEQNFDISAQVASAAKKDEAAKKEYEQQQQRQAQQSSNSANRPAKQEPGFWGKLGAIALQGLANTAIEATNYKYGTNIETIGNNNNNSSGGNGNQTCTYDGQTFHGDACQYCILNKPRSSSACNKCCHSLGRSLMQAPIYYPNGPAPGFPPGCYCRFGPTSGIQF